MRLAPVKLPDLSFLAAGEPLAGKRPVKPRLPSLTLAEDLGLEFEEAQGAVCKPQDSVE